MTEPDEMNWVPPGAIPELPPNAPPGTVRVATGSMARFVNAEEAREFGISTERPCLVIEQVFYDAEDDVLQHTVTVNYSGHPHEIRYQPTPEDRARHE
ncbi:UTRA domain-containing protein [Streptomyces sp. NPDC101455]|uniref:UTRA domain-containing protein n=1 Tax=Streptomyces sp. NPDC101455 TaxID=3366142 RepID=UPI003812F1F0